MRLRSPLWGYVFVMAAVLILGILVPALAKARDHAKQLFCGKCLTGLSNAIRIYAHEHEGRYPAAEQWCDLIMDNPGGFTEQAFWCREDPKGSFSYAMNKNLIGVDPNKVPIKMVVLFESDLGRNGLGGPEDIVLRHEEKGRRGCNIVFNNGQVRFVMEDEIANLKWTAEEESGQEK